MRELYNEGRVAGLSNYELYVRQLLSQHPDVRPLTEREWLAAGISTNCSMILRVPSGTQKGYVDFTLPEGSDLCGCTVIYGSVFEGEITLLEDGTWAARVDSYGTLISNTVDSHPVTPGDPQDVPTCPNPEAFPEGFEERCRNFLKITSAIMFQPGQWVPNSFWTPTITESSEYVLTQHEDLLIGKIYNSVAVQTIIPDFTKNGCIRLAISDTLTADTFILLHGFSYKSIIQSVTKYTQDVISEKPQDGDFLGPQIYPWGCPVVLIVSSNVASVIESGTDSKIAQLEQELQQTNEAVDHLNETKQNKQLENTITIGQQVQTSVEGALNALNNVKSDLGVIPVNPSDTTGLNVWIVDI